MSKEIHVCHAKYMELKKLDGGESCELKVHNVPEGNHGILSVNNGGGKPIHCHIRRKNNNDHSRGGVIMIFTRKGKNKK